MFKPSKLITILMFLPFFCSCSTTQNAIAKDNVESLSIIGELLHTQYWNKNDAWDLNGLFVYAYYSDGTSSSYPFSSKTITYTCIPEKPTAGLDKLTLTNVCYIDYLGNSHLVCDEIAYSISIVDYPYDYAKISLKDFIVPIIIVSIIAAFSTCGLIMYCVNKKKRK